METSQGVPRRFRRTLTPKGTIGWIAIVFGIVERLAEIDAVVNLAQTIMSAGVGAFLSEWGWLVLLLVGMGWLWWVGRDEEDVFLEISKISLVEEGVVPLSGIPIVFVVTVRNTGPDTTLDKWKLLVEIPGSESIELTRWTPDNDWEIENVRVLHREDHLPHKTFEDPVRAGGRARGFLTGNVQGRSKSVLMDANTVYAVECVDIHGNRHRGERRWGDLVHEEGDDIQRQKLPGMKYIEPEPPTPSGPHTGADGSGESD